MNPNNTLPEKSAPEVDFPIERVEAEHVSRREFTKFLCLVSGGMAVGSGWVAVKDRLFPPHRIQGEAFVCNTSEVPLGGTHTFTVPGSKTPFILIHLNDGSWRAYEQKCTHLSCAVIPELDKGHFRCPCHNGYFDLAEARPIAGPARRPLSRIKLERRDGKVYAVGVEERTV